MKQQPFQRSIDIPFQDIDAAGVLFFGQLFPYAHETYEGFMGQIGHALRDVLAEGRYRLPLVHAEADYLKPIRHGECIIISLQVQKLSERSFALSYRFKDSGGQLRATAQTVHAAIDANCQPISLNDNLRQALADFMA